MKSLMFTTVVLLIISSSQSHAAFVDANETAWLRLDSDQSITCIAYYIPDVVDVAQSLKFTSAPEYIDAPGDFGDFTGWQTGISTDNKTVYCYGPANTNTSTVNLDWFTFRLFFQWDDLDPDLDPAYPVYLDIALFDGGLGSPAYNSMFFKGLPGGWPDSWVGADEPLDKNGYTNPVVPEPATLALLSLGLMFLRKRS